jgi:hypothetical protein
MIIQRRPPTWSRPWPVTFDIWNIGHILGKVQPHFRVPGRKYLTSQIQMMLPARLKSLRLSRRRESCCKKMRGLQQGIRTAYRQPGLCNIFVTCFIVSASFGAGVISILQKVNFAFADFTVYLTLVIHTTTGTPRAKAMARCSLDIPINPALAPTIKITHEGAPEVRP